MGSCLGGYFGGPGQRISCHAMDSEHLLCGEALCGPRFLKPSGPRARNLPSVSESDSQEKAISLRP